MNTTPIEKCSIGKDAKYDVQVATAKGWTNFAIFPNGRLVGTSPSGVENEIVPQYAEMLKECAPELLAALETAYNDIRPHLIQYAQRMFNMSDDNAAEYTDRAFPVLEQMRAAIAKAKGEANA